MREPEIVVEKNMIGLIGLAVSALGLLTCGLLSPLGLVISLAGLVRPPRLWAILGVALGAMGTVWFFWYGVATVREALDLPSVRESVESRRSGQGGEFVEQIAALIQNWHAETGELPAQDVGQELLVGRQDLWARTPQYRLLAGDRYEIRSAGPDQQFDTADDLVYEETVVLSPQGGLQVPPANSETERSAE